MLNNFVVSDTFDFPTFEHNCLPYFAEIDSSSKDAQLFRSVMYQDIKVLKDLLSDLKNKEFPDHMFTFRMPKGPATNEITKYCFRKLERMEKKVQAYNILYYENAQKITKQMIDYYQKAIQKNKILSCKVNEYKRFIFDTFPTLESFDLLTKLKHISDLDSYAKKLNVYRFEPINDDEILQSLKQAGNMLQNDYLPLGKFDDDFLNFCYWNKKIRMFDNYVQKVVDETKNKNGRIDYSLTKELNEMFLNKFTLTQKEETALKAAIVRVFFDRLYIKYPKYIEEQENYETFLQHCKELRDLTPAQLQINRTMITPEMTNTPFSQIIEKTPYLIASVKSLKRIEYFTNTIDMCSAVFKALRGIHCFVNQNQHKSNPKNNTETSSKLDMSFDDCFSIFMPLFAYDPPSNSVAVSNLMYNVVKLNIPSHFEFAQLIYTSIVSFIQDINLDEFLSKTV
ncbi:hypothetical protein TRFO_27807 [Tritrichomonas foetus]|uniref:VPS9 domain-containing protein n=1 Tax=Tritrichomonas foetus TaxID=1144522 RepID=A0A1J4K127_9EUKA|nr:hypothetical protein TRFO_27807 [Tritrichomonas foetus]|eukprot:OHT04658.1 hypothetical protein TRFO_27807 [Tritrichomonas foetus]